MATAVKSLHVGELVDVDGRRYEVVPDGAGDLTLEPAITPMAELDRRRGAKPASREDFDRLFGPPADRRRGLTARTGEGARDPGRVNEPIWKSAGRGRATKSD